MVLAARPAGGPLDVRNSRDFLPPPAPASPMPVPVLPARSRNPAPVTPNDLLQNSFVFPGRFFITDEDLLSSLGRCNTPLIPPPTSSFSSTKLVALYSGIAARTFRWLPPSCIRPISSRGRKTSISTTKTPTSATLESTSSQIHKGFWKNKPCAMVRRSREVPTANSAPRRKRNRESLIPSPRKAGVLSSCGGGGAVAGEAAASPCRRIKSNFAATRKPLSAAAKSDSTNASVRHATDTAKPGHPW